MSNSVKGNPQAHTNADPHARVMARLERMSPREILETSVRAGVHTPDGKLTPQYTDSSAKPAKR